MNEETALNILKKLIKPEEDSFHSALFGIFASDYLKSAEEIKKEK